MSKEEIFEKIIEFIRNGENLYNLCEIDSIPKTTIQSLLMEYKDQIFFELKEMVKSKEYDKALKILNYVLFKDEEKFQSLKVRILIKKRKYKEAFKICNRDIFQNNEFLQSQKITLYVLKGKCKDALRICNREIFQDVVSIQSQKVSILTREGKYDEALNICNREIFQNNEILQSQNVTILFILEEDEKALKICNREIFQDVASIQSQKVSILMSLGRFEEALEICNREIFQDNRQFLSKKKEILRLIESQLTQSNDNFEDSEVYQLASLLYYNKLSLDNILTSDLCKWMQTLLLFAYFEKIKSSNGISYMKKWKRNLNLSQSKKKIWNQCMERLQNKRTLYLQTRYDLLIFGTECVTYHEEVTVEEEKISLARIR